MSSNSDASDILDEILEDSKKPTSTPESQPEPTSTPESQPEPTSTPESEKKSPKKPFSPDEKPTRKLILVGVKPLVTYVNSTLTQLSTLPTVTIKARGQRITQAVDVSQFIMKRMHSIGYRISDVRISSDALESRDGKTRNVSTIEIDISK
ncbi:DNA-binding protein [Candidatus Nitrosopelagicus sp.]|nr:DNA-binding protein [Candidatus Nitrosopelagicus sp.]